MATYKQIQAFVKGKHGFQPKTCWIAHVKEMAGLEVKPAWNRVGEEREECSAPQKLDTRYNQL